MLAFEVGLPSVFEAPNKDDPGVDENSPVPGELVDAPKRDVPNEDGVVPIPLDVPRAGVVLPNRDPVGFVAVAPKEAPKPEVGDELPKSDVDAG